MIDILFAGIGWTDIALTLSRIAVGAFFMLSGYHKLFNAESNAHQDRSARFACPRSSSSRHGSH
jgi:uncharacterized membrane protein YphA (DoxX/SURF4 family)